ncbi:unnamed protein product [Effrenium voratum]|nr:unnamed protein product [Effrenium voratum]
MALAPPHAPGVFQGPASFQAGYANGGYAGFSTVLPSTIGAVSPVWQSVQVDAADCFDPIAEQSPHRSPVQRPHLSGRSGEVYVQTLGNPSNFKAVAPDRVMRLGARNSMPRGSDSAKRPGPDALSVAAVAAASSEVLRLARSNDADREIFQLAIGAERSHLLARCVSSLLQGSLGGLSLLAALLAMEPADAAVGMLRRLTGLRAWPQRRCG